MEREKSDADLKGNIGKKEKGLLKSEVENHSMNPFANHMAECLSSRLTNLHA